MIEEYISEFEEAHFGANARVQKVIRSPSGDSEKLKEAREIDSLFRIMKRCISTIDLEVRSLGPQQRLGLSSRLTHIRQQYEDLQRQWLLTAASGQSGASPNMISRSMSMTHRIEATNEKLRQSQMLVSDSEQMGNQGLCDLNTQRESINRVQSNVSMMDSMLTEANARISRLSSWWGYLFKCS